mmetsp:Transcript_7200/g.29848  ORF Transcript_7200/g.29848 Transcript_7200/m.29848 type:complete len:218 (+) Transcript_7200:2138-2791(+)
MRMAAASASAACASASFVTASSMSSRHRCNVSSEISIAVSPAHVLEAISAASVASATISDHPPSGSSDPEAASIFARSAAACADRADARAFWRASSALAMSLRAFVLATPSSGEPLAAAVAASAALVASRAASKATEANRMHSSRCASIFSPSFAAYVAAVAPPKASCASSSDISLLAVLLFWLREEGEDVPARPLGGDTNEDIIACSGRGTTKSPP